MRSRVGESRFIDLNLKSFRRFKPRPYINLWTTIETMKTKKLVPIHPGEILLEDFMKPRGLSQTRSPAPCTSPRRASMRLSMASVRSRRKPPCGSPGILGPPPKSGWECRRLAICGWLVLRRPGKLSAKSCPWRRDAPRFRGSLADEPDERSEDEAKAAYRFPSVCRFEAHVGAAGRSMRVIRQPLHFRAFLPPVLARLTRQIP